MGCVAGFYAQVSMAGRSMNRLWHKMVAAAVGSCIHVCRGSWGATGISLSKGTDRGAVLSRADGTSAADRLALLSSSFSYSLLRVLFIGNSPSHRICISLALLFPQHSSISVPGGIHCSPQARLCLCWDDIHLLSSGLNCSTSHHLRHVCNFTRSPCAYAY